MKFENRGNRMKFLIGGLALCVALSGMILWLSASDSPDQADSGQRDGSPGHQRSIFAEPSLTGTAGDHRVETEILLKDFKKWAQYPPWSRPLSALNTDEIRHAYASVPYETIVYKDHAGVVRPSGFVCRFQPATDYIWEGKKASVLLDCVEGNYKSVRRAGATRLELAFRNVKIQRVNGGIFTPIPSVALKYGDNGVHGDKKAGDKRYTFLFSPGRKDWGSIMIKAKFAIKGDPRGREYEHSATFFSSPVAPAHFTGEISEEKTRQALTIFVDVRIKKGGQYRFYGNLKNKDKYISIAKTERNLKPGAHRIPLRFFGKIFRDKEAGGPYTVFGIRGIRRNDRYDWKIMKQEGPVALAHIRSVNERLEKNPGLLQPDREIIPPLEKNFVTRKYRYTDFANKEWDSPEKRARIAAYLDDLQKGE